MSTYLGSTLISGVATETKYNANNLLDFKWSDHIINSMEWLRADTFSWQSGAVYVAAYNHLSADYSGGTSKTETIGSHTITFVEATDGHRITTDESTVADIYAESGVAWFYVLDTTNQRFKLPRSTHGQIVERLTSGSQWAYVYADGWCEQGGYEEVSGSSGTKNVSLPKTMASTDYSIMTTDAQTGAGSGGSSIKSTTLAVDSFDFFWTSKALVGFYWEAKGYVSSYPSKGQYKYLYFYVGQFSQSATEQTAGLNSELFNGKMDLDGNNATFPHITQTYINGTDWYRVWSDGWCEQGGTNTYDGNQLVTLLVPFKDTNYFVLASVSSSNNKNANYSSAVGTRTTTQFNLSFSNNTTGNSYNTWRAYGYIS